MKVMVLGSCGSGKQIAAALAISLAAKQTEVVVIGSLDDIEPSDGDVLVCDDDIVLKSEIFVTCGHPLANIGKAVFPQECHISDRDNSFRGGSRGKGGKIKYTRK